MAGITDLPFRNLVSGFGAGLVTSEMITSGEFLTGRPGTRQKAELGARVENTAVQIAGRAAAAMGDVARQVADMGARVIDINMGCPVKKVCHVASGSALLRDEALVARILKKVVAACQPLGVPVTLKTRTGWDRSSRNAVRIARLAEDCGIAALTLHGRTRCDLYTGEAEYETIRAVRQVIRIPLIANGDINTPEKARAVLDYTGADAIMVGRAAQGRPWIFREIAHYLAHGSHLPPPTYGELRDHLLNHLEDHYSFYGEHTGVRTARKHIGWYLADLPGADVLLPAVMALESTQQQFKLLRQWLDAQPADAAAVPESPLLH
jgi:tRNA-dihydrouridine synthase B